VLILLCAYFASILTTPTQISEAFEVLSDKQKRTIYDQVGEEGLKSGRMPSGGFPEGFSGGFPGGTTFSFSTGPGGNFKGFSPTDSEKIFQ
jgi:DnaJ homolog subfamily B member 4